MKISWKDLKETGLAGLLGVTINQACFIFGLYYTSAINAAALQPTQPVFTAIGMLVLRKEKFSMLKLASILTTIAGCMCLMFIEGAVVARVLVVILQVVLTAKQMLIHI